MGVCRVVIQAGYRGPSSPHASRTAHRHRLSSALSTPCWGCSLGSQVLGQCVCVCVCVHVHAHAYNGLCRRCCVCVSRPVWVAFPPQGTLLASL